MVVRDLRCQRWRRESWSGQELMTTYRPEILNDQFFTIVDDSTVVID